MKSLLKISENLASLHSTAGFQQEKTQEDYMKDGIEHFNNLRKKECLITFEMLLDRYPEYTTGRIVFSSLYDRFGDLKKSIFVLQEGIQKFASDMTDEERQSQFRLNVTLGKLRYKLFQKYSEYQNIKQLGVKKKELAELALSNFTDAREFGPKKVIAIEMSAKCLESLGKHEKAKELWGKLKAHRPEYLKRYASSLECLGKKQEMISVFEECVEKNPHDHFAYERLAYYNKDKQSKIKLLRKGEFFKWVPKFCSNLQYSEENYEKYIHLTSKNKRGIVNFQNFKTTFESLLQDKSIESTEFLISMIHHHIASGSSSVTAFAELNIRSEEKEVQELLFRILDGKNVSPTVMKHTITILAKRKHEKLFDKIIKLLPSDMSIFDKGIPEALALLGIEKAVPFLVKAVNLSFRKRHKNTPSGLGSLGHLKLRQRCSLALSFFENNDLAIKTLIGGLKIEDLQLHCSVGLYKLKKDKQYLKPIIDVMENSKKYVGYDIYIYLKSKCEDVDDLIQRISTVYEEYRRRDIERGKTCNPKDETDEVFPKPDIKTENVSEVKEEKKEEELSDEVSNTEPEIDEVVTEE